MDKNNNNELAQTELAVLTKWRNVLKTFTNKRQSSERNLSLPLCLKFHDRHKFNDTANHIFFILNKLNCGALNGKINMTNLFKLPIFDHVL